MYALYEIYTLDQNAAKQGLEQIQLLKQLNRRYLKQKLLMELEAAFRINRLKKEHHQQISYLKEDVWEILKARREVRTQEENIAKKLQQTNISSQITIIDST